MPRLPLHPMTPVPPASAPAAAEPLRDRLIGVIAAAFAPTLSGFERNWDNSAENAADAILAMLPAACPDAAGADAQDDPADRFTAFSSDEVATELADRARAGDQEARELLAREGDEALRAENARLREALSGLLQECLDAGFGTARDYRWPTVIAEAQAALAAPERDERVAELERGLSEIASQCHNLPRGATADWIDERARALLAGVPSSYDAAPYEALAQAEARGVLRGRDEAQDGDWCEPAAKWHEGEAVRAIDSLHCGSENEDYRSAQRVARYHRHSAEELRRVGRLIAETVPTPGATVSEALTPEDGG